MIHCQNGPPEFGREFGKMAKKAYRGRGRGSSRITLRLTDEESAQLAGMCQGMTISAFVRERIFHGEKKPRKARDRKPVPDEVELARALAMLGQSRIANNLNQLAYQANTGALTADEETLRKIDEAYAHVISMRQALLSALGRITESRT